MNQSPISVVIPAYDSGDMIQDALNSVLAQTLVPSQIIVIDDGSKDDTSDKVAEYGERVVYRRQTNAGPSAARNHGVRLATCPFVAFLDADDVWHPKKLELQMRHMERDPGLGLLATDNFDWPIAAFPEAPDDPAGLVTPVTWEQLVVRTLILTSTVVARREVLARVGEFDCSLRASEDRDLFLRMAEIARMGMLHVPLVGYRDSPGSLTKQADICEWGMRAILRRLDERRVWRGRWLLRSKAYSHMHCRCSAMQARASNHVGGALRAMKSMVYYPLPYRAEEATIRFERPKRLAVNVLRMLRLKRPDPGPASRPAPQMDALRRFLSTTADTKTLVPAQKVNL